jgi:3-oxoadipate enol-lactonase
MPFAPVNGQQIFYTDSGGDGPPVVLGHGFLMDQTMFDHQVAALAPSYRVVTWDERGFGQTDWDGKPFTYWDSASDCLGLMSHLEIDRAVVGGMSQGGFLSLRTALTAPERVRALILLSTAANSYTDEERAANKGMVDMWLTVGPVDELVQAVATIIIDDPVENPKWIAKWQARDKSFIEEPARCLLEHDDVRARLGEITCPALVVHGHNDQGLPMSGAEEMASLLPGCDGVVKVDGAHAPNLTNPKPVNDAILSFLARLPQ